MAAGAAFPAGWRRRAAGRHGLLTLLAAAALALAAPRAETAPPSLLSLELPQASYAEAREALLHAIENEGLLVSATSAFGEMLARTDADLQHGAGAVYAHAEVFAFCSVRVAARLVLEDAQHIALCPLSMALYQRPRQPGVTLAWRVPDSGSAGGEAGAALLRRIAERTREDSVAPAPR